MVALAAFALLLAAPVQARSGSAHNFPEVAWHTFETEHLVVHWPESTLPRDDPHWFTTAFTAGRIARVGEEVWPKVTSWYGYEPREKIHYVVYELAPDWEGNGFALAEWDWVSISGDPSSVWRPRGRMEWIDDTLTHEFAHIISLKTVQPFSEGTTGFEVGGLSEDEEWLRRWGYRKKRGINADLGFDVLMSEGLPVWWVEGTAEYTSHVSGYNNWGTSREAFLRMSFLEGRVLDADQWVTIADKQHFEPERCYNQGYNFGLYLGERFGIPTYPELGKTASRRWFLSWDKVVEEMLQARTEDLWRDWHADRLARFTATAEGIRNEGEVSGRELALVEPPWEKADPEFLALPKKRQHEEMDGKTAYQELPSWSPDGNFLAWFEKGLNLRRIRPEEYGAISGTYIDKDDDDALEAMERRTASFDFANYYRVAWAPDSTRFLITGPEDFTAEFLMNNGLQANLDGYNWSQLIVGTVDDQTRSRKRGRLKVRWSAIPNTLRAREAAWSPDGATLAFSRYGDGTHEIWTIRPDGSEARQLTRFGDGTQVQGLSFTKDGKHVLSAIFRNKRQDLYLVDVSSGELVRLTNTEVDETDPFIGPDGRAWFTSDYDGVYNVYTLDLETGEVFRQTNLVGGAYGVNPTPGGHLFYTAFTGHGYRIHGLSANALQNRPLRYLGLCGHDAATCSESVLHEDEPKNRVIVRVAEELDTQSTDPASPPLAVPAEASVAWNPWANRLQPVGEPSSLSMDARSLSEPYKAWKALMPLSGWPVARTTDKNAELGAQFFLGDYSEAHWIQGEATAGKDNFIYLSYFLDTFWPSITVGAMRYTYKGTYGYGVDEDGLPDTRDDIRVVDLKFEQAADSAWSYVSYSLSPSLWVGLGGNWERYAFRDTGDGQRFVPYTRHLYGGPFVEWDPRGLYYDGDDWINPRGGRRAAITYEYHRTRLMDPEYAGGVYDDGEALEAYGFHKVYGTWTEFIPLEWFGLAKRHTLQLDLEGGWIDRNVMSWDEFMAGGKHPYFWGNGTIGNNTQFSGYEGWSLSGETMLILNAAWRFPLARNLDWRLGPIYTESVYLQLCGSVGNLWSYRIDGPAHVEGWSVVADDPSDIRRELPFKDYAYKNSPAGHPNYLLQDAGVELRVKAFIWNDWDWDSFLRVSYGFQPTAGYGDVNNDLIQSSVARDAASELSDEIEAPTFRFYAGLGTGW
jgi:hypothetical protein